MNEKSTGFWNRVDQILKDKNMKKAELMRQSGVDQRTISKGILLGTMPLLDNALKIAAALGVTVQYLLYGTEDKEVDVDLEEAYIAINKSRRQSEIAKILPSLNSEQLSAIESMIHSWGYTPKSQGGEDHIYGGGGSSHTKALA